MANYCRKCGAKLASDVKFCPECGEKIQPAPAPRAGAKSTVKAGPAGTAGAKSTLKAGTAGATGPDKNRDPGRKRKSAKGSPGLCVLLSAVMVLELILIAFWQPGLLRTSKKPQNPGTGGGAASTAAGPGAVSAGTGPVSDGKGTEASGDPASGSWEGTIDISERGFSGIVFGASDTAGEPERAQVSIENPAVRFQNGVRLEFGDYCLNEEPGEVSVQPYRVKDDGEYQAVCYDLKMDGGSAEFAGLVTVTLPYDPDWGDNVCVQYYDEENGAWIAKYTEAENGLATIRTTHFSKYAAFRKMVDNSRLSEADGDVFDLEIDEWADSYFDRVHLNYRRLAAQIKAGKIAQDDTLSRLLNEGNRYWMDRGLTISNNTITGADYYIKLEALLANPGASKVLSGLSTKLGYVGMVISLAKLMYQWYRDGFEKALSDNVNDLSALLISIGGQMLGGPVGLIIAACVLCYYVYSTASATISDISLQGNGSLEELAYRTFTSKYVTYNPKTAKLNYTYFDRKNEEHLKAWANGDIYDKPGYHPLPSSAATGYAEWKLVFDNALERKRAYGTDPAKFIDTLLSVYTNVFWNIDDNTRQSYLKNTQWGTFIREPMADSYKTPSTLDQRKFSSSYKKDLYSFLKPYMLHLMEIRYEESLDETFEAYCSLEHELNSTIRVQVTDPRFNNFEQSPYSDHDIGLANESGKEIMIMVSGFGTVEFTKLSWLRRGAPSVLRVKPYHYEKNAPDLFNIRFEMKDRVTTIPLERKEGIWELQAVRYTSHSVTTVNGHVLAESRLDLDVPPDARSFSGKYQSTDEKKNYTGVLPGALVTGEQLNKTLNKDEILKYHIGIEVYMDLPENLDYSRFNANEFRDNRIESRLVWQSVDQGKQSFFETQNVTPLAEGTRTLFINYGLFTLIYRERPEDEASAKKWKLAPVDAGGDIHL